MTNKCQICKEYFSDSDTYEYRGFLSCGEHFEQLIEKVDIRRAEIIRHNDAVTAPMKGFDLDRSSPIGKANCEIFSRQIEVASKETFAEKQYRDGIL